jgi:hypothetical protein
MLGRFWSMDQDELEPGKVSGVIHDERTTNWPNLKSFGEEMRVVHVETTVLA